MLVPARELLKSMALSFIDGFARALDIGATRSPHFARHLREYTGMESDARALAHDWKMVGKDLRVAEKKLRAELHPGTP